MKTYLLISIVSAVAVSAAPAAVFYDAGPGTGAPTGMLGGYTMTAFPPDPQPIFTDATSIASPLGGELEFSKPLSHRRIGSGWASWSHGYAGDVYLVQDPEEDVYKVTLTLPPDTGAFEFYVQPDISGIHTFTAVTDDGTSSGPYDVVASSGARYAGFYATEGSTITSIEVACESRLFAIGEFGIARVPEPGAVVILLAGSMVSVRRG